MTTGRIDQVAPVHVPRQPYTNRGLRATQRDLSNTTPTIYRADVGVCTAIGIEMHSGRSREAHGVGWRRATENAKGLADSFSERRARTNEAGVDESVEDMPARPDVFRFFEDDDKFDVDFDVEVVYGDATTPIGTNKLTWEAYHMAFPAEMHTRSDEFSRQSSKIR